jgi:hypothetical protein
MDYPGKVITKTQVTPTQTSASGNWTLDDQAAAIKNNNWPVALVPNPISKSLRFNSADSANLTRTFTSTGNRRTFTWSGWIKISKFGTNPYIFSAGTTSLPEFISFGSGDQLNLGYYNGSTYVYRLLTTQVFRDPSAWYHIIVAWDTTQATASNRIRVYVNGLEVTAFSTATYPSQNYDSPYLNTASAHSIGSIVTSAYLDAYQTEINFIDGQQLTPSSFGMTNPQTGQWIPLKYSGTYGTNGFYLNFKDATSTTTLGLDYSGNANNWTANNFSVTAGSGNDSLTDVPTPWFSYSTTGDSGGVVRGNYCTWNRLQTSSSITLNNGNLDAIISGGFLIYSAAGTVEVATGKWYYETVVTAGYSTNYPLIGVCDLTQITSAINTSFYSTAGGGDSTGIIARGKTNVYLSNNTSTSDGVTYNYTSDVIMIAFDADLGKVWFGKNGTWNNSSNPATNTGGHTFSTVSGKGYRPYVQCNADTSNAWTSNFGQRPFAYTPPTGFRSLCTTNLPATAIGFGLTNQGDDYFNTVLYTGNGSSQSITGVGFQPDFTWIKSRSGADNHNLFNSVVGLPNRLFSNLTNAENTTAGTLTSFNSNGFSVGSISDVNANGVTFEGWNWKAGGTGVSNTAGTITSTVSANTTAGFSVVTYTGTGANATVGHGLGAALNMIILKRTNSTNSWQVYHSNANASPASGGLFLNTTDAFTTLSTTWNNTVPTSTVFSIGTAAGTNASGGTYVAYCFAAVPGFSAFGSWVGNGSTDGPFIYTGFRPRYLLQKGADVVRGWNIWDTARSPYNAVDSLFQANSSGAESTGGYNAFDLLSNGFKVRSADANWNNSGSTYIYMAFAESPFQFANAR